MAALLFPLTASSAVMEAPSLPASGFKVSGLPTLGATISPLSASVGVVPAFSAASAVSFSPALIPVPVSIVTPSAFSAVVPSAARPVFSAAAESGAMPRGPLAVAAAELVAETVRSWAVPVEDILADHEVLLVGESHGSLASMNSLAEQMPRLAKAGVAAVGVEGLKSAQQDAVDQWMQGRRETLPEEAFSFSPKRRAALLKLYESARRNGVRVVALGLPLDDWARQVTDLVSERGVEIDAPLPKDFPSQVDLANGDYHPLYNEIVAEVALKRRNLSMAARLRDALPAGVKGVAVVGSMHIDGIDDLPQKLFRVRGDYGHMAKELALLGLKAFSLSLVGGDFSPAVDPSQDRLTRPRAYRIAGGAGSFTTLDESKGLWHADASGPVAQ